jgi:Tfp pilus assembly protein PilX
MNKLKSESGFTIIVFLALLLMLTLAGINAVMTSTTEVDIAGNEMNYSNAFYAAEGGLEKAAAELQYAYRKTAQPPEPLPTGEITVNEGGYSGAKLIISYSTELVEAAHQKTLVNGAYRGLYALATEYEVSSEASTEHSQTKADLRMMVESDLVPLYQFAVFYEPVLEIAPGPAMTLGGRVHSNGDLYLQSGNSLTINSHLTAAGNIFHGTYPGSGQSTSNGDVYIHDAGGNPVSMYQSGEWVDANATDWVENSLALWGGQVEDNNHGITELNLPVVQSGDPIDMIKTAGEAADSYENKATLKIVNGTAIEVQPDGSESNVTADLLSLGVISYNTFYDGREGKNVESMDINVGALNGSGYWPRNGIIYTAENQTSGSLQATRLVNGTTLGGGLTISSKNPVYVEGDYNSVNKKPAAIMTDAMTILSNAWNDGDGTLGINDANRQASPTTVNVSYMTGNVPSEGGSYSGGFENLPRFLENWSNIEFKWRGSAIDLWESEEATGDWSYGSYYTAPYRNWEFDPDLLDPANLPPGTPLISIVQKTAWREVIASQE